MTQTDNGQQQILDEMAEEELAGTRDREVEALTGRVAELERQMLAVSQERDQLRLDKAEFEEWKEQFAKDAHEYADDHDWCGDYDEFMSNHGMPRRIQDFEAAIDVTYRVLVRVRARNEEEAEELATRDHGRIAGQVRERIATRQWQPEDLVVVNTTQVS